MIAQTLVNLSAGSRARLSGIVAALTILVIILFELPVIEKLPHCSFSWCNGDGSYCTFEWISFES
jgi:SulP family sulfate permease